MNGHSVEFGQCSKVGIFLGFVKSTSAGYGLIVKTNKKNSSLKCVGNYLIYGSLSEDTIKYN